MAYTSLMAGLETVAMVFSHKNVSLPQNKTIVKFLDVFDKVWDQAKSYLTSFFGSDAVSNYLCWQGESIEWLGCQCTYKNGKRIIMFNVYHICTSHDLTLCTYMSTVCWCAL